MQGAPARVRASRLDTIAPRMLADEHARMPSHTRQHPAIPPETQNEEAGGFAPFFA